MTGRPGTLSLVDEQRTNRTARLVGRGNQRIGVVDAEFVDYLLVRSAGLIPIDLYVPRAEVTPDDVGYRADCSRREAYVRWHRPLKRVSHD